jgi:hypothetical protein
MEVENRDSDTAVSNNVSANLLEISPDGKFIDNVCKRYSCLVCLMFYRFLYLQSLCLDILNVIAAVEKSFPTSFVSPEKATGDCKKSLLEDEHDKSIKMSEVNVVRGSGGNRRSVRLHNIKLSQKKQPATEGPPKYPNEHQISPSAALEKSDGGHESPSTPVQSQLKGPVNALSEQVTNKFASRVFKATPGKTEGCYKKKRVTIIKSASSVKSSHERNVNHLNKGSKQRLSVVSPESLSLKKSRSGNFFNRY